MTSIAAENLGPISQFVHDFKGRYGIHIVYGSNGVGKSILLDGVKTAARGSGRLPLKDHTQRGSLKINGSTVTIGATCRHTGEWETDHIEGKFDIGTLIDPKMKSPASADAARIKALVALTGAMADPSLFRSHEAFLDWEKVVDPESIKTDDLVEMARRIKADYDRAARAAEADGEKEEGHAAGLSVPDDLDMTAESDQAVLQERCDKARDHLSWLCGRQSTYAEFQRRAKQSEEELGRLTDPSLPTKEQAKADYEQALVLRDTLSDEVADLEKRLAAKKAELESAKQNIEAQRERVASAVNREKLIAAAKEHIASFEALSCPNDEEVREAIEKLSEARKALEQGVLIRRAQDANREAAEHRQKAAQARERAARLRDAGRSTDDVLSAAIQCSRLRVESDGKSARLVCDTERGKGIPYHDLSHGERGAIAIDIAADQIGEGGMVTVEQEIFEGIDSRNRQMIDQKAIERKIYVLTAEAKKDPDVEKTFTRVPLGEESGASV